MCSPGRKPTDEVTKHTKEWPQSFQRLGTRSRKLLHARPRYCGLRLRTLRLTRVSNICGARLGSSKSTIRHSGTSASYLPIPVNLQVRLSERSKWPSVFVIAKLVELAKACTTDHLITASNERDKFGMPTSVSESFVRLFTHYAAPQTLLAILGGNFQGSYTINGPITSPLFSLGNRWWLPDLYKRENDTVRLIHAPAFRRNVERKGRAGPSSDSPSRRSMIHLKIRRLQRS